MTSRGRSPPAARRQSVSTPTATDALAVATPPLLADPVSRAASLWNGNPLPTDDEYGGSPADRIGSSGPGFAGYFAARHGFSPTETPHDPPFRVVVARNGGEEAHTALRTGTVDIAALRAETFSPVESEVDVSGLVRHDLFRTGKAVVVSDAVYRAGADSLDRAELRGIYNGRITDWGSVGGPDREIHLVGTVNDAHPETFERTFLADEPQGGADALYGRASRKRTAVADRDDTLTRLPIRSVERLRAGGTSDYRILDIEVDGEPRGPGGAGYPGTYPVPLFTAGRPDRPEQAFLDALSAAAVHPMVLNDPDGSLHVFPASSGPDS